MHAFSDTLRYRAFQQFISEFIVKFNETATGCPDKQMNRYEIIDEIFFNTECLSTLC